MAEEIKITNDKGLDMLMGNAQEIDLSSTEGAEVINPKDIAQSISEAAEEDVAAEEEGLSLGGLEIEKKEKKDDELEEEEEVEDPKPADAVVDEDTDPETFKVLGQYFSDEGILEGFTDEMENTPEAFKTMIDATVEKRVADYKNNFNTPVAKQFLEYLDNGGDPGKFLQLVSGPDYSQVTPEQLGENNAAQKEILRAYYTERGESAEEVEDMIQTFEDAGNLGKRANSALGKLQASQAEYRQNEIKNQAAAKAAKAEEIQTYIEELKTNIDSREELGGFQLTKKTKNDLFDYVTKIDNKTGKTKFFEDSQNPEKQLLMTFMYFNDFNFNKLEKKVKANTTKDLISKLSRTSDTGNKQKSTRRTPATPVDPGNPDFGVLKKLFN